MDRDDYPSKPIVCARSRIFTLARGSPPQAPPEATPPEAEKFWGLLRVFEPFCHTRHTPHRTHLTPLERRRETWKRTSTLPTIIEKSSNPRRGSARPGIEPGSHPSAADPPSRAYGVGQQHMNTGKALFWSSCGSGNEGIKKANGEGVRESVCHDGVKQLAAAVNGAG